MIISGLLEIVWAYFMKQSHGFTRLVPTITAVVFMMPSFFLLERGIRLFGIGMAYAVFTGIGIAGTTGNRHNAVGRERERDQAAVAGSAAHGNNRA